MVVTIRTYEIVRGTGVDLARIAQGGLVAEMERLPGFRAYYLAEDAERQRIGSVSVFDNRESAEKSDRIAARWVERELEGIKLSDASITDGDVLVSSTRHAEHAVA